VNAVADVVAAHLVAGSNGVDVNDGVYDALSTALEPLPAVTAAATLLDVIGVLVESHAGAPAVAKLIGILGLVLERAPDVDADKLRRSAAALLGSSTQTQRQPGPAPDGALRMNASTLAALRKR
jgi:hypothetical protein